MATGKASRELRAKQSDALGARAIFGVLAFSTGALVASVAFQSGAHAATLRDALASAYRLNPDIEAERANLRATDEGVPQAKSGYRPTISGSANVGAVNVRTSPGGSSGRRPSGYS